MRAYCLSDAEFQQLTVVVKNVPKNVIAFKSQIKEPEKVLQLQRFVVKGGFVYVLFFDGHLIE